MSNRNIEIKVRLNRKEAEALNKRVKKSRLSREAYLRHLISGVVPQDAPPPDYFDFMRELHGVGNNLRMVLPIMLVSWRKWRMAVSTPSKETQAIRAARTAIRLDTTRSMGTEPRHINSRKKDPAETGWVHKGIIKFIIAQWLIAFSL